MIRTLWLWSWPGAGGGLRAQAGGETPSWLMGGAVELPFEVVGLGVGLVCSAGLIWMARRAARPRAEDLAEREQRERASAMSEPANSVD